ncbi:ORF6N domain-containing protein, partial [Escherichia coli]|nr:ORF6N domain-containing protein [Escherichia coli]EFW7023162.1 ORF6N domain-containing protein [Shigella sonnei]EED0983005.1 ORF6N domain-containing protein [Escherichia coli]EED1425528.1 ORF6N domain-containing protein [Escherichia coli]EEQ1963845.1 ORF6N domain-containing protein [Escherichia coli]
MTMQLAVESLVVVTYSNVPVITTGLLANLYKTEEKHIRQNFKRNECRFIAGKHFFKVSGCELDSLRTSQRGLQISPKTRSLILWTERGAARHAKMLETDQA